MSPVTTSRVMHKAMTISSTGYINDFYIKEAIIELCGEFDEALFDSVKAQIAIERIDDSKYLVCG